MSDTSTSELALRQAWRQADLAVARSLAALCYGKETGADDVERLSQLVSVAVQQRREAAIRLAKHDNIGLIPTSMDTVNPSRSMEQILQATGQTRALRPSKVMPSLPLLRQRLLMD